MEQWDHELAGLYCSELPEGREESFEQYLRGGWFGWIFMREERVADEMA